MMISRNINIGFYYTVSGKRRQINYVFHFSCFSVRVLFLTCWLIVMTYSDMSVVLKLDLRTFPFNCCAHMMAITEPGSVLILSRGDVAVAARVRTHAACIALDPDEIF